MARWAAGRQKHLLSSSHLVSRSTCTGLWGNTWGFSFTVKVAGKYLNKCCVLVLCVCVFTHHCSLKALDTVTEGAGMRRELVLLSHQSLPRWHLKQLTSN